MTNDWVLINKFFLSSLIGRINALFALDRELFFVITWVLVTPICEKPFISVRLYPFAKKASRAISPGFDKNGNVSTDRYPPVP